MSVGRREALLAALESYRAEESGDEAPIARFGSFLERSDPFHRGDPDGHVTASAIVARSQNVAGTGPAGLHPQQFSAGTGAAGLHPPQHLEFLLVFHRKLGRWLQPGGHVDPDDPSVFDTALREAREETGLTAFTAPIGDTILDLDVHSIPAFGADPAHSHYDVRFLLTAEDGGPLEPDAAWFPFDAVGPTDTDGSLVRAVRKAAVRLRAR